MTKYTGLIRTLAGLLLASTVGLALIIQTAPRTIRGTPIAEPEPASHKTELKVTSEIPEPPVISNGGKKEFEDWVDEGMPGYIPDTHTEKNGNDPETIVKPMVVTTQVTCEKPQTPESLGLSADASKVYEIVCALFPEISTFGGFRAGDQDHGTGNAIDCMVYADTATGNALAQWLLDHWSELPLKYIIWQQRINYGNGWEAMEDRGSPTQNHQDHVHISVN